MLRKYAGRRTEPHKPFKNESKRELDSTLHQLLAGIIHSPVTTYYTRDGFNN